MRIEAKTFNFKCEFIKKSFTMRVEIFSTFLKNNLQLILIKLARFLRFWAQKAKHKSFFV